MSRNRPVISSLALGLLLCMPSASPAVTIFNVTLSCTIKTAGGTTIFGVDPPALGAFQLDVQYDPTKLRFDSITYVSPFVETSPPILSPGFIDNIAGNTTTPPTGNPDIFMVNFTNLVLDPGNGGLLAFAQPNDFVTILNTDTGQNTTFTGNQITPCGVPEPPTLVLASTGALVLLGYAWRRCKRGVA